MSRPKLYFHVYMILDFPITYRNTSVLCQSECAYLHQTVNMAVFFVKSNENTYPKGRALMQMYRVVPITKRENWNDVCNHIGMKSAILYLNDICNRILEWHLQSHIGMTSADVTWICIMYYIFQVLLEARRLVRSHSRTYRAKYSPDLGVLQPGYRTWQELVQSLAYVGPYELWGCLVL